MFKSNSGEPYAGKLHVRFLEEFISNCLIIREGENLLMPKPRKDWKALNIKIQSNVYDELEKYCEETGLSKTVAVERILSKAFKEYKENK